ncbi:MAG: hypothetical protein AAGC73_00505 [Verrucomicrobiota bacterium]
MPAYIYHILHILGLLMIFTGYGALLARSIAGSDNPGLRKLGSITSGIGLVLVLVAGFALISKMGYAFTQGWILVKLVIWLILGGLIAVINRKAELAGTLWWVLIGLGGLAAIMVYARPF